MVQQGVHRLRERIKLFDWHLIKGSVLLSFASVMSRAAAMAFWFVLARALTTEAYGATQYAITLGTLAAAITHPFGQHVIARFLGKARGDQAQIQSVASNSAVFLLICTVVSLLVVVPVLLVLGKYDIGVLAVFAGLTVFYTYWGLSSGLEQTNKLSVMYFVSNVVQIVVVAIVFFGLGATSSSLASVIFGLCYFPTLIVMQIVAPFRLRLQLRLVSRQVLTELAAFSWPIWISHLSFTLYTTLPILFLEYFIGSASIGIFSLGFTLTQVFSIINSSVATLMMPKMAGQSGAERAKLFRNMLAILLSANIVSVVIYLLTIQWFVQTFFGAAYVGSMGTYVALAISATINGVYALIAAVLVGSGNVGSDAFSRTAMSVVCGISCWLLVPTYAEFGAAMSYLLGIVAMMVVYLRIVNTEHGLRIKLVIPGT